MGVEHSFRGIHPPRKHHGKLLWILIRPVRPNSLHDHIINNLITIRSQMQSCIQPLAHQTTWSKNRSRAGGRKENKPSTNNRWRLSLFGKSLDPGSGWPSFHPTAVMKAIQISATGTCSAEPTSRVACAYSLTRLAVLLGWGKAFSASKASSWYSLTGGGAMRMILGFWAFVAGCWMMVCRFFL